MPLYSPRHFGYFDVHIALLLALFVGMAIGYVVGRTVHRR